MGIHKGACEISSAWGPLSGRSALNLSLTCSKTFHGSPSPQEKFKLLSLASEVSAWPSSHLSQEVLDSFLHETRKQLFRDGTVQNGQAEVTHSTWTPGLYIYGIDTLSDPSRCHGLCSFTLKSER